MAATIAASIARPRAQAPAIVADHREAAIPDCQGDGPVAVACVRDRRKNTCPRICAWAMFRCWHRDRNRAAAGSARPSLWHSSAAAVADRETRPNRRTRPARPLPMRLAGSGDATARRHQQTDGARLISLSAGTDRPVRAAAARCVLGIELFVNRRIFEHPLDVVLGFENRNPFAPGDPIDAAIARIAIARAAICSHCPARHYKPRPPADKRRRNNPSSARNRHCRAGRCSWANRSGRTGV